MNQQADSLVMNRSNMDLQSDTLVMNQKVRLYYLDNLKVFLICLVIAHHVSQAYGPTGGEWVYHNPGLKALWLGSFMTVNASFFMGLFFMISGYFLPHSFKSRSFGAFIKLKLKHLMLPVLLILTVIVPVYFYLAYNLNAVNKISFFHYYMNTYWKEGLISYEYGWFLVNLFMYSLVYAVIMLLLKNRRTKLFEHFKLRYLPILALLTGILSFFIRLIFPTDTWINLFGFIGMEPAHLPQYVLFFVFGIFAYNNHYFDKISKKAGSALFIVGLIMALLIYLKDFDFMQPAIGIVWNVWPLYESFMAVFISIGLIIIFREYFNRSDRLLRNLTQDAFGVYIIHNFFVVLFQILLDGIAINASLKFIFVSILSIITAFMTVFIIRRINRLKIINAPSQIV